MRRLLRYCARGDHVHLAAVRIHAADDLQQRESIEAGFYDHRQTAQREGDAAASRPARGGNGRMTAVANPEYAIDVQGLNKHFGDKHVVKNVSLRVRRGEIFGFLGPNGSGKTTTIRMMCGLLHPDSGSGTCLGYDILRQSADIKRNVGYMTQRFSFWDDLTITENLDFVARMYQVPNRREVVKKSLENLGLSSRAGQLAGELSGGWKQRMALAACMLHNP